jgi:hypothetical protein
MMNKRLLACASIFGALSAGGLATNWAAAADLDFDFKVNQGPVGTTFATLSLQEFAPGMTTFTLNTDLSGGQGNPGIVELFFGCNGCSAPNPIPGSTGITIGAGSTQAGYDFDFKVAFAPGAIQGNTPLIWTASGSPELFLESTSGAGPSSFALIQLTGGTEVIDGQNITSGFYVAAIPEPSTYALMLAGLGFVAFMVRRRNG